MVSGSDVERNGQFGGNGQSGQANAVDAPELGRSLVRALRNTGISVLYQDRDLKIVWGQNIPKLWSEGELQGQTDDDFLPKGEAGRLTQAKRTVLQTGNMESLEICVPDSDGPRWFDVWIDADHKDNEIHGIITTAVEVTEQKRREQTLRTLLRELSHRSKNLLAIIQSIATQTGRYSDNVEAFLGRFRGRLQSLASSQDLVTMSNWRGADLHELVHGQLGRYCADPARNIRLEGANPYLSPNAALHIGLALHELAVNSVSFGALSRPTGVVTIKAGIGDVESGSGETLTLEWLELLESDPGDSAWKNFGTVALERVVPTSLDGQAELTIGDDKIVYRLIVPRANFEIE